MDTFKSQVAALHRQGYRSKVIAEKLNASVYRVTETIAELIAEGTVESKTRPKYTQRGSAGFERVVELLQSGASLNQIGKILQVSRERVRQIREKIRKRYGDRYVKPKNQRHVTVSEAARLLGTDAAPLMRLLRQHGLLTKNSQGLWVVQRSHLRLKKIVEHPYVTLHGTCSQCGKEFRLKHRGQQLCSTRCAQARRKGARQRSLASDPTEENLAGWHKELLLKLRSHRPPEQEEWLTLSQASRRSGLTPIQVNWLRLRKVLTCRASETLYWRNRPVQLYRASEIDVVRQCHEESSARL